MRRLVVTLAVVVVAVAIGVAAVVAGGADDSPGLQALGVVVALAAVVLGVRSVRRSRRDPVPGTVSVAGRAGPGPRGGGHRRHR